MHDVIVGRTKGDKEKFGTLGTVLLGKQYIQMGRNVSLANKIYLDVCRAHVFFICGKRGAGKCLHGDTLITLSDGAQVSIKDLENDKKGIFTLNNEFKIKEGSKSHFYKRPVNKLLELTLRSGKKIKVTPEHPLLTVKGWMPAEKLHLGARIATPRKIEAFGDTLLKESKVKLLAYLIAEGHLGNGFVLFSNKDEKIVGEFKDSILDFDKNLVIKKHSKESCFRVIEHKPRSTEKAERDAKGRFSQGSIFEHKSSLRKWLEIMNLYGKNSLQKFIPKEIFTLPKRQISLFLNRLFSCDGTIYKKQGHWFVSYCSSSDELINQVQHLLSRFGIVSRIRKKTVKYREKYVPTNELVCSGEHVSTFITEIGFYGIKEEKAAIALQESIKIVRNPNVDTIPKEIWDLYRPNSWAEIGRKIGYKHPKALRESTRYSPSRQKLLQIARADESELLEKFACSDIFWDEIVSLEFLEGSFIVYDLTVPETHNFVANDIIVHNSYTMGAITEGMASLDMSVRQNLSFILLDTMGIYWTMKYPNKKDTKLLAEWGFKGQGLDVKIFTPYKYFEQYKKEGIPTDYPFSMNASELDSSDWQMTFELDPNNPTSILIERTIHELRDKEDLFTIDDIIAALKADKDADKNARDAAVNRFMTTKGWGLFAEKGMKGTGLNELALGGKVTVLDVSCYATMPGGWKIKHLIVGLVAQKLFIQRMVARKKEEHDQLKSSMHYFSDDVAKQKRKMPLVWLVIDEAHEFLPRTGSNPATEPLVTILREGRQPGISLILATQQPGKIHTDVMTQSDTVLSHRITARLDVEALGMLMQSYMREGLDGHINNLPRSHGACVMFDDTNERMYSMQVRPRFTWHGGESPSALMEKKKGI